MKKRINLFALVSVILVLAACSATTAHVDNVKMCTSVTDNLCNQDNPTFTTTTPEIYCSCNLKNAPENTEVEFAWYYLGDQKIAIDAVTISSGDRIGTLDLQTSLSKPFNGWPKGKYEVAISIVGFDKTVVKSFSVQ